MTKWIKKRTEKTTNESIETWVNQSMCPDCGITEGKEAHYIQRSNNNDKSCEVEIYGKGFNVCIECAVRIMNESAKIDTNRR